LREKLVVHRDLKPDNVFVSNKHYTMTPCIDVAFYWTHKPICVKLSDFGKSQSALVQTQSVLCTSTCNLMRGSPAYLSPETLLGNINSASLTDLIYTDIWALGMTVYCCVNPDTRYPYMNELEGDNCPGRTDKLQTRKGCRKKLSSSVLTSTPVKEALREQQHERTVNKLALAEKRSGQSKVKKNQPKKKTSKPVSSPPTTSNNQPKKRTRKSKSKPVSLSPGSSDEENCELNELELCNDDSDDDIVDDGPRPTSKDEAVAVRRFADKKTSKDDNCLVCGEFGRNGEYWYRCRVCAYWAHKACTDATRAKDYVCDLC